MNAGIAMATQYFLEEARANSSAVRLLIERNRRLRGDGEQHDFRFVEAVPEPNVSAANSTHPRSADWLFHRFEIRQTGQLVSSNDRADRPSQRKRALGTRLDQPPELTSVPSRYSSSSRHDSSPLPCVHIRKASVAAGDRNSPRSAHAMASRTSAASSGCGFHSRVGSALARSDDISSA